MPNTPALSVPNSLEKTVFLLLAYGAWRPYKAQLADCGGVELYPLTRSYSISIW